MHIHEFKEYCCLEINATACDQESATKSQSGLSHNGPSIPSPPHTHTVYLGPGHNSLLFKHNVKTIPVGYQKQNCTFGKEIQTSGTNVGACPLTLDQPQETEEKLGVTMLKTLDVSANVTPG